MNFKNLARTNFGGEPIYTPAQIAEAGSQTTWWRDPMNASVAGSCTSVAGDSVGSRRHRGTGQRRTTFSTVNSSIRDLSRLHIPAASL